MDIQKIKELALANGFSLKEQPNGEMDLNPYVYDFANAIEQAAKAQPVPEGFVLVPKEPTLRMLKIADEHIMDCNATTESVYKAMIEAQEPSHISNLDGYTPMQSRE